MQALFKVTFRNHQNRGTTFTSENVLAEDAVDAAKRANATIQAAYKGERLFASDVELLGVVTISMS